jgi:hypothetical protein
MPRRIKSVINSKGFPIKYWDVNIFTEIVMCLPMISFMFDFVLL